VASHIGTQHVKGLETGEIEGIHSDEDAQVIIQSEQNVEVEIIEIKSK